MTRFQEEQLIKARETIARTKTSLRQSGHAGVNILVRIALSSTSFDVRMASLQILEGLARLPNDEDVSARVKELRNAVLTLKNAATNAIAADSKG
jgi:hypothetical protein